MKLQLLFMLVCATPVAADTLLVDVCAPRANQCVFTREGRPQVMSPVVVDKNAGLEPCGFRVCRMDLTNDPHTGTIVFSMRDTTTNVTGPNASYPFPLLPAPKNPRVVP